MVEQVPAREAWPKKPAETAIHEIADRNSQAKAPCDELANRSK
jgi:hypothetical protein